MAINRTIAAIATVSFVAAAAAADTGTRGTEDFAYRAGGVGQAEAEALRAARSDYSLGLTFATREGAFLADVGVQVKRADGEVVLSKSGQGPMVLVDLPPGRYIVEATSQGRTQNHAVELTQDGHRHVTLAW